MEASKTIAFPVDKSETARVQTMRGLACLLLVSFHVIGANASDGIRVADDSAFRTFANLFLHLRMPLFVFLSGLVYAYKPIQPSAALTFTRKKLTRLLIPFVVVSTLFFVVQQLVPGANNHKPWAHMWEIYVLPYIQFWYLQAAIVLFVCLAALERLGILKSIRSYLVVLAIAFGLHAFSTEITSWFSVSRAAYLAPFFLLGIGAHRFRGYVRGPLLSSVATVAFVGLMAWQTLEVLNGSVVPKGSYLATAISLAAVLFVTEWTPRIRWLGWIGGFSFTIYLYHVFFSAGSRIVLKGLHLGDPVILFTTGLILAIFGPILLEIALRRYKLARTLLLGQGARRARTARPITADTPIVPCPSPHPVRGYSPGLRGPGQNKSAA
jgi:glucans biosynthesis protein C